MRTYTINGLMLNYYKLVYSIKPKWGERGVFICSGDAFDSSTVFSSSPVMNGKSLNSKAMHVFSGGTANRTFVSSGGTMYVSSGGTANNVNLNPSGSLLVSSGAYVSGISSSTGARLEFPVAPDTYVNISCGSSSAIIVDNSLLSNCSGYLAGALISVSSGGTAKMVRVLNGMNVLSGGIASDCYAVSSGGSLTVFSGGIVSNCYAYTQGLLTISAGGTGYNVTASSGGTLTVFVDSATQWSFSSSYNQAVGIVNLNVISGGIQSNVSSCYVYVSSGGSVNSVSVGNNTLYLYSGGRATNVNLSSGRIYAEIAPNTYADGSYVYSTYTSYFHLENGVASSIVVRGLGSYNTAASINVLSGGTAVAPKMDGGYLHVSSGGTALSAAATTNSGYIVVSSGGVAKSCDGGITRVFSGGTAISVSGTLDEVVLAQGIYIDGSSCGHVENGAASNLKVRVLHVLSGGTANAGNAVYLYVSSGGTANSIQVQSAARAYSGGVINSVTVNSGGCLTVSSGETVAATKITNGGRLVVSSGGTATDIVADSGAGMQVTLTSETYMNGNGYLGSFHIENGVASNFTAYGLANTTGGMTIASGCTAVSVTMMTNTWLTISSGGTATGVIFSGGSLRCDVAPNTYLDGSGYFGSFHMEDGVASNFIAPISMNVYSGGTAVSTLVNSARFLNVYSGGTADYTTIKSIGSMYVYSGGVANSTTVNGRMYVSKGGMANATVVNNFIIVSSGTAISTTVNSGASMAVSGGTASFTEIKTSGKLSLIYDGTDNYATVNSSGTLVVSRSGKTSSAMVNRGGSMYVQQYGTAIAPTVNSGGYLIVSSGGTAIAPIVNSDGYLRVSSGGTATDVVSMTGASIYSYTGATVTYA